VKNQLRRYNWDGMVRDVGGAEKGTAYNTALPAPLLASLVVSPNPWPVTLFAEGRKQCAGPAGSATRNVR